MGFNLTCNSTLEDMRIDGEVAIVGPLNFHQLALCIGGFCTLIAILLSFYLMWMHALNYTKPEEQRQIIRILLMVPVYAASAFLQIYYYYHAIYFQVISDCYEAFAIASFFTLMCYYIAPDLHEQKNYFRNMRPVKPWVWPLNWFAKCCGGQRGIWRTPKSGLTWFNIIWIGIYHYCFVRVAMTITAVVTQYFERYCESSNSPVFAHIWVLTINSLAVTVAMYCVIQFYVQLREPLAEHKPFLKVLAIKLVIFLAFWQMMAISVATSSLQIVHANDAIAYPDLKVGIPALLICFEMALFALMHLWAFPYQPYKPGAKTTFYPLPDPKAPNAPTPKANEHGLPAGGALGLAAFVDALNIWDVVKAFGRGMRWLFCGVKTRKNDPSYRDGMGDKEFELEMSGEGGAYAYAPGQKSTDHLPIASQFRRSTFGIPGTGKSSASSPNNGSGGRSPSSNNGLNALGGKNGAGGATGIVGWGRREERKYRIEEEEHAGLIAHAQASPSGGNGGRSPGGVVGVGGGAGPYGSPALSPYHDRFSEQRDRDLSTLVPGPEYRAENYRTAVGQYEPSMAASPLSPTSSNNFSRPTTRDGTGNFSRPQTRDGSNGPGGSGRRIAGDPRQTRPPPRPARPEGAGGDGPTGAQEEIGRALWGGEPGARI